jgi:hypothetical protein
MMMISTYALVRIMYVEKKTLTFYILENAHSYFYLKLRDLYVISFTKCSTLLRCILRLASLDRVGRAISKAHTMCVAIG